MYEVFNRHFFKSNGVTFDKIEEIRKKRKRREKLPVFVLHYALAFCIMDTLFLFTGNGA